MKKQLNIIKNSLLYNASKLSLICSYISYFHLRMVLRDLHVSCVGIQTNLVVTAMKVSIMCIYTLPQASYECTRFWPLWWQMFLLTRVQSVLKHCKLFCNYHNIDIMTIAWHVDMGIRLDRTMVRSFPVRSLHSKVRSLHEISYFATNKVLHFML